MEETNRTSFDKLLILTQKSLNKDIVKYLKSRGISKQSAVDWGIGYLPNEKMLLDIESDQLYDSGILIRRVHKSPLNQYITFPMFNQYREIIGFSGRPPLDNAEVKRRGLKKYWHSRFDKRKFLFGLDKALQSARKLGYIIVAEGQFDIITAHQYGVTNIVATCGTALTEEQTILLSRYVDRIYVIFDNDDPGKKAFEQLEKHKRDGTTMIPVILPDTKNQAGEPVKEDPDSFIRKFGKEEFMKCILSAHLDNNE